MAKRTTDPTAPAAIAKRLKQARRGERLSIAKAAKQADVTPAEWRAWEAGKAPIPHNKAWRVAQKALNVFVGWLLRAEDRQPDDLIEPFPQLSEDLSGFADRVKQAREAIGLTLADVKAGLPVVDAPISTEQWLRYENGLDEPSFCEAEFLARILEVSIKWLYTDTEPQSTKKLPPVKRFRPDTCVDVGGVNPGFGRRMKAARELAGYSVNDAAWFLGEHFTVKDLKAIESGKFGDCPRWNNMGNYLAGAAILYGVPFDWLLFGDNELTILRRRIERLAKRFGLPRPPGKRKSEAAARLQSAREAKGLTIEQAAKLANVDPKAWTDWESGREPDPYAMEIAKAGRALGMSANELILGIKAA